MATQQSIAHPSDAAVASPIGAAAAHRSVETTGRYKIVFDEDIPADAALALLQRRTGIRAVDAREFGGEAVLGRTDAVLFDEIGVAIASIDPDQTRSLGTVDEEFPGRRVTVSPEYVLYAVGAPPLGGPEYLRGFGDGIAFALRWGAGGTGAPLGAPPASEATQRPLPPVASETDLTWGLQITRAARHPQTGRGTRIAVLDTGIATSVPDWASRAITSQSFVPGESTDDGHGHGTHCAGTACGTASPNAPPIYGIAPDAELFVGKVLSSGSGRGEEAWILDGISWAIRNRCDVISMSLGAWVPRGYAFDAGFEKIAQRALQRGTIIVAAAGNDSDRRNGRLEPVNHPANCPSVMAVGALSLDESGTAPRVRPSEFSNAGLDPNSFVDIAAPGDNILSAWPLPPFTRRLRGTSMATPHVAGLLALWAEATGDRGESLWRALSAAAVPLPFSAGDVGAGLAQAP